MILFIICCDSVPLIENPMSSVIFEHERLKWLVSVLRRYKIVESRLHYRFLYWHQFHGLYLIYKYLCFSKVQTKFWRQAFWMKLWGHDTFKRTKVWSTSFPIYKLNLGKLDTTKHRNEVATTRKYMKDGKKRFVGTRGLKSTQWLRCIYIV